MPPELRVYIALAFCGPEGFLLAYMSLCSLRLNIIMDWFSFVSSGMRSIGSCFYWSQDVQTAGWSVWVFFNTVLTVRQKHQRRIKHFLSNNCPINIWTLTQLFLPSCRLATIQGNAQEVPEIWSLFVRLLTLLIQCKRLMWRPLTPFFSLISTGSCILIYVQTVTLQAKSM